LLMHCGFIFLSFSILSVKPNIFALLILFINNFYIFAA